jgi:D-sedoheptulose 7-phosphate isomerase
MKIKNINKYVSTYIQALNEVDYNEVNDAIELIKKAWLSGNKIIAFGNGGSALNVQHYMNDWVKSSIVNKRIPFYGLSLVDNVGLLTSYANDFSYDEVFLGQLKPLLAPEDIIIAVSGSGNSPNVIKAVEFAKERKNKVISVTGFTGGSLIELSDCSVHLPLNDMQMAEDFHLQFGHMVMKSLFTA